MTGKTTTEEKVDEQAPEPSEDLASRMLSSAPAEQIGAAIAAGKTERAADLLARHGSRLMLSDDNERLLGWLDALPSDLVTKNPSLAALHAWLLVFEERYDVAIARVAEAERALMALELASGRHRTSTGTGASFHDPHADVRQSIVAIRAHLGWLRGDLQHVPTTLENLLPPASADHPLWRAFALVRLARCRYMAGELVAAAEALDVALVTAEAFGTHQAKRVAVEARVSMGRVRESQGRLDEAVVCYDALLAHADDEFHAAAEVGLARVAHVRGDLEGAAGHMARGLSDAGASESVRVGVDGWLTSAWISAGLGDQKAVGEALTSAERFIAKHGYRWANEVLAAHRAALAIARGDVASARRWAQRYDMRRTEEIGPIREIQQNTRAALHLTDHEAERAFAVAHATKAAAIEGGRWLIGIEAAVLEGASAFACGRADDAIGLAIQALEVAAPLGAVEPFLRHYARIAPVLAHERFAVPDELAPLVERLRTLAAQRPVEEPPQLARNPTPPPSVRPGVIEVRRSEPVAAAPAVDAVEEAAPATQEAIPAIDAVEEEAPDRGATDVHP